MGEGVFSLLENAIEAASGFVTEIKIDSKVLECGEGGEDRAVYGGPLVVIYCDVGKVMSINWAYNGRLDLLRV